MPPADSAPLVSPVGEVRWRSSEFFDQVRTVMGERFGEARIDPDGAARVTILELSDEDTGAIHAIGESLHIAEWVRIENADPDDVRTWQRLRADLRRAHEIQPPPFILLPTATDAFRRPPVNIVLTAGAASLAAHLHRAYGDFVSLQVGALPYPMPPDPASIPPPAAPVDDPTEVDASELEIALDGLLVVESGRTITHGLMARNHTSREIRIATNGHVTATIIDDHGAAIGGYSGMQNLPLVFFTVAPGAEVRIPLLVGTDSFVPQLGYTVPAATWRLMAPLDLDDGRRLRTPPLEVTIVARADQ